MEKVKKNERKNKPHTRKRIGAEFKWLIVYLSMYFFFLLIYLTPIPLFCIPLSQSEKEARR